MKGRERMGSSVLFEKMKCIFSIVPVGKLEKSRECFSPRNTHRTLAVGARTLSLRVQCAVVLGPARVKHQTVSTGRRAAPVHASGAI